MHLHHTTHTTQPSSPHKKKNTHRSEEASCLVHCPSCEVLLLLVTHPVLAAQEDTLQVQQVGCLAHHLLELLPLSSDTCHCHNGKTVNLLLFKSLHSKETRRLALIFHCHVILSTLDALCEGIVMVTLGVCAVQQTGLSMTMVRDVGRWAVFMLE